MFNFEQKMERIAKLSQKIKAKEPAAVTDDHKQAAIARAEVEQTVFNLIMDHVKLKIIFFSLLYFWLKIEALLNDISEQQFDKWPTSLDVIGIKIIETIKSVINSLPDPNTTDDLKKLGEHINTIKSNIPDEEEVHVSKEEFAKQTIHANTKIFMVISNLLNRSFHPEIVSNIVFGYLIRASTINTHVTEEYYQKMEFYFSEIIAAVRKQVPIFFKQIK